MSDLNVADHLRLVPIFSDLPPDALDELAGSARLRRFPAGQVLFSEGDPGDYLVVLEEGHLKVCRYSSSGEEIVLAVVEPPACVGELALIDGAPRDATIIAQRPVVVWLVSRGAFLAVLRSPAAIDGLLGTLAARIRLGNRRHADFVSLDVPGRLAKWLLGRAGDISGEHVAPGAGVDLERTQAELAAELGTTRSTLNRALQGFAELGLVDVEEGGARVIICKPGDIARYL